MTETIDKIPDDALLHAIHYSNDYSWNFFALKVILTRLKLKMSMFEGDPSIKETCCSELRNLLKRSANVPNLQIDLKLILSLNINYNDP